MQKMTSSEFKEKIELDPAWASTITEPTEITDYCYMEGYSITHLSPLLHFTYKNSLGYSADFQNCQDLKIGEGNFAGLANFSISGIEEIGQLTCGKSTAGNSANFQRCLSLKTGSGTYEGKAHFALSGIEKLENITCGKNEAGHRLNIMGCDNLHTIPTHFNLNEIDADKYILTRLRGERLLRRKNEEPEEISI